MSEDFIQYLWKYKKFRWMELLTTTKETIQVHNVGVHNTEHSGPDFFNAQLTIDGQRWAGNVELHLKASDWYVHHHEIDPAYDNVILHVVWEEDVVIFRRDNSRLPTLVLQPYVPEQLMTTYQNFFNRTTYSWLYCESSIGKVSDIVMQHWKERIYIERLVQKSKVIEELWIETAYDWEAVLFRLLAQNFGLKNNQESFLSMARSLDFTIVRKCSTSSLQLEALFLGQLGLLSGHEEERYPKRLWKEYLFLKHKFKLNTTGIQTPQFFRLRPPNFPTIRLAQLAQVYVTHQQLFAQLKEIQDVEDCYALFAVATSPFWKTHYTFDKTSPSRAKKLTRSFIDLIVMNTIIPLQFVYGRAEGRDVASTMFDFICQVPKEKNRIINRFEQHKVKITSALDTQALLQLKKSYCDQKRCLACAIGNQVLQYNEV